MGAWRDYLLTDLLMYSPAAYFRLYELANIALWPLHLAMGVIAIALVVLNRRAGSQSVMMLLLAPLWVLVAWGFFYRHYMPINPYAMWFVAAFGAQALLLMLAGLTGGKGCRHDGWAMPTAHPGLALFGYGLLIHPLIGLLSGRTWHGVEWFGIAPDPTALVTLGILLMGRGAITWVLTVIPLCWCLASGMTFLAMDVMYGLATLAVAAFAVTVRLWFQWAAHRGA